MTTVVYGIDLGTTNSACAAAEVETSHLRPVRIDTANALKTLLPSKVLLEQTQDGVVAWVGRQASRRYHAHPVLQSVMPLLVEDSKRKIGLAATEVWPFGDLNLDATDFAALILRKVVKVLVEGEGAQTIQAVVTHPRDFQVRQKQETAQAAMIAGISLLETIDEPVAALYSWYRPDAPPADGHYMVFDLGGGTLDIAILEVRTGQRPRVVGGHGEPHLGGRDWDEEMFKLIAEGLDARHQLNPHDLSAKSVARLYEIAEEFKRESGVVVHQRQETLVHDNGEEVIVQLSVTRNTWKQLSNHLVERCKAAVHSALQQSALSPDTVLKVIPAGGGTRLEMVREALKELFGGRFLDPDDHPDIDLDHAIARGAARYAAFLARARVAEGPAVLAPIETTLAHGLNVEVKGRKTSSLLARGQALPLKQASAFSVEKAGPLKVSFYEGEPGPIGEGDQVALVVDFGLNAERGDTITFTADADPAGRITFEAVHHRLNQKCSGTLHHQGDEPASSKGVEDRKSKHHLITVY